MGRVERQSRRYRAHRPARARIVSERPDARALDEARARTNSLSRIAGADLLAGLWRARRVWRRDERAGEARRNQSANRDRARPSRRGIGIVYSQHAGMVVVADGSENSKSRLERVLTSDPGLGVLRHADAGYSRAIEFAVLNRI